MSSNTQHAGRKGASPGGLARLLRFACRLPLRIHRDESGAMGLVSLFTLILLVTLLGMVINSARQVDRKVKMQNAADAAAYSGGVVIARNMNTLAFTNHLLCDVFALTAYMREARDQNAASMTPQILDNWDRVAPAFAGSPFPKFAALSPAMAEKAVHERAMVQKWSMWSAAASELMLPVFEQILANELIPRFQRDLVNSTPQLAQYATDEAARRHGLAWPEHANLRGVLWRTMADPVGGMSELERRTLPVVDPVLDATPLQNDYFLFAKSERRQLSHLYLNQWNNDSLQVFDELGKMSRFSRFWRIFTCGQLEKLLREYPGSNLPFQIRNRIAYPLPVADAGVFLRFDTSVLNPLLQQDFMFVGVVYTQQMRETAPGVFRNPSSGDDLAYSQVMVFVPRRRLIKVYPNAPVSGSGSPPSFGGVPGQTGPMASRPPVGIAPAARPPAPSGIGTAQDSVDDPNWLVGWQSAAYFPDAWPNWNLLTQNWIVQPVPANTSKLPQILSTTPYVNGVTANVPNYRGLTATDLPWLSHH